VVIKDYSEPLQLDAMAAVLAHAGICRTSGFVAKEQSRLEVNTGHGGTAAITQALMEAINDGSEQSLILGQSLQSRGRSGGPAQSGGIPQRRARSVKIRFILKHLPPVISSRREADRRGCYLERSACFEFPTSGAGLGVVFWAPLDFSHVRKLQGRLANANNSDDGAYGSRNHRNHRTRR